MTDLAPYIPYIVAVIFFTFFLVLFIANRYEESADVLRTRVQAAKREGTQNMNLSAESVRVFEAEHERLLEVRLDDFFKELSKKRGVSTSYFQRLTAGVSAGAALLVLLLCIAASFLILKTFMALDFFDSIIAAIPAGAMLTISFFRKYQDRREKEFLQTFPLAFDVVSRGLKAGGTIEKTFRTVADQIKGPVGQEFNRINQEVEFGVPFEEALVNAAERIQIDDFSFFTIALIIQKKAGGSLSDLVANISLFLRKRQELRLKVKSLSAEAKATGLIVGSLPILILVVMYFINPETIDILRNDPAGRKLSIFLVLFMLTGIWIIKKMINIRV